MSARITSSRRTLLLRFWATALLLCIGLFAVQGVAFAAALPSTTLSAPANVSIGANFSFTATFDSAARPAMVRSST